MRKIKVYKTSYTDGSIRYTPQVPEIMLAQDGKSVDSTIPQPTDDSRLVTIKGYIDDDDMVILTPEPGIKLNWICNEI